MVDADVKGCVLRIHVGGGLKDFDGLMKSQELG